MGLDHAGHLSLVSYNQSLTKGFLCQQFPKGEPVTVRETGWAAEKDTKPGSPWSPPSVWALGALAGELHKGVDPALSVGHWLWVAPRSGGT